MSDPGAKSNYNQKKMHPKIVFYLRPCDSFGYLKKKSTHKKTPIHRLELMQNSSPVRLEWAEMLSRHSVETHIKNEHIHNLSGSPHPHLSQPAEPLWTNFLPRELKWCSRADLH